jgi:exo-beta-1,3-glucanase (GH17 family)
MRKKINLVGGLIVLSVVCAILSSGCIEEKQKVVIINETSEKELTSVVNESHQPITLIAPTSTPTPTRTQVPYKPSGSSGGSIYRPITTPILSQPPIAVAGDNYRGYINKSILFNGSDSYDEYGEIVNAEWNIDNESKQGLIVSYIFDKAGEYNVSLTVKDENGAYGVDYANVLVFQPTEKTQNWSLNLLVNHSKEENPNYSGPASSKMILDYLWGNETFSQDELYSYGHKKNEINISDIDAKAMKEILNEYKPKKYNFDIVAKENKTDLIKDIVHWFNYEVPAVERANAPNTVPTFGSYDNWIVVKGAASDKNPNATQNPIQVGNFTVYGLWVNDPGVDGIGSNSYKTADEFSKTFLEQMKLPDSYIGKYIAVLEPPEADEQVSIAQPYFKDVNKRYIEFVNKEGPYKMALIQSSTGKDIQSNTFSYYDLLPQQLLNDTSFMNAFNGSIDKPPIEVNETNGSYYLTPFEKSENISVVLKIDGKEGYFREAAWMDNPVEYKLLTELEAKKLVENYTESKNLSYDFRFEPNINILNVPVNKTQSPYYPLWEIFDLDNNETYVITSDKQVYGKDTKPPESVTNLTQVANGTNFINVSWINPDDKDYKEAFVYINGSFKQNVSKATNFYNATNLTPSTEYSFSVRTADDNGNVNKTFVNLTARTSTPITYRTYGLDFSPYMDGQDPNLGSQISEEQLRARLAVIAPYTQWIRTFSSTNGLEKAGRVAHEKGLKVAASAWLSSDLAANNQEISNLINASKDGDVDLAIVGSEVLLRGDLSESQLIGYINRVKGEVPEIQVTTADVYGEILSHPAVVSAVDVVLVNYYPYWEGIGVDHAVAAIHGWHQLVTAKAGGKPVIVSETGWPSCGNQIGDAMPSPENASLYFMNFVSWARANNVSYFYFEAFDESWKAAYEGPQGACWGIWNKDGILKPSMQDVFDNKTIPDDWSGIAIPGGPGNSTIEFTYVPPYGSFENLRGQVWHVRPGDYKVAVYIDVGGGWWTKPYFSSPLTSIWPDGSWTCDITTGGVDQSATAIVAYLIPNGYSPPLMSGGSTLPAELELNSVAKVETTRAP